MLYDIFLKFHFPMKFPNQSISLSLGIVVLNLDRKLIKTRLLKVVEVERTIKDWTVRKLVWRSIFSSLVETFPREHNLSRNCE